MSRLNAKVVEELLAEVVLALKSEAWLPPGGSATAAAFEKESARQLQVRADARNLGVKVILHSGRKFPDIVFENTEFGVEIKTAQKGWACLGNSVMASTLVDGVTEVFLLFGSGEGASFTAKWGKYEDCVKDVEVTHSPRYVLDMDIEKESSYLSRIGHSLADMLTMEDPVGLVVEEARKNLKPGEHVWWISDQVTAPLTLKHWNSLTVETRNKMIAAAFAFFPEKVLKTPNADYELFVIWLLQRHTIINSSVRDSFSAGGRVANLEFGNGVLLDAPKVFRVIRNCLPDVKSAIIDATPADWASYYNCSVSASDTQEKRLIMWSEIMLPILVARSSEDEYVVSCIRTFLESLLD